MAKITIENYRGIDIEFDTHYEKFQCIATEDIVKESVSFKAVKKFIDDYKKENQNFKAFEVTYNPNNYEKEPLRIVGLRKDGRFVTEDRVGKKEQISDYNLSDYILYKKENEPFYQELKDLEDLKERQRIENNQAKKDIISKMNIVHLKDFKKSIL